MDPGKIFTRDELKQQFNLVTEESADRLLDMMEAVKETMAFKVIHVMDERLLVFEAEYWQLFLDFMKRMGYNHDSEA